MANPIRSCEIVAIDTVVSGTNSSASPAPWSSWGQKTSQYPAFRFSCPIQISVPPPMAQAQDEQVARIDHAR